MKELLVDPTVVLAIGGSRSTVATVDSLLTHGSATDVVAAEALDAAIDSFETRNDVGCVLVLGVEEAGAVTAVPERIRAVRDDLPVVVYADDLDERVVGELARWHACRYVPRSADGDTVLAVVDDALATYERRRLEAADNRLFQTLLDEGDISLFAKDARGRYVRTTGLRETRDHADTIGKTDREIFGTLYPRTAESTYRDDLAVVRSGEPIRNQRERFGTDYWSETTKIPVRDDDGTVTGLVGYALDVTDEVESERRLAAQNRRFDQFASYVSHDLRTPLQVAYGALDRARDGDEAALDKLEEVHDRIEETIDDLRQLTDEDLDPESNEMPGSADSTVASTDLRALVEKIWGITAPSGATLNLDVPEGTVVVVESELLRPLMENFLKNAVDHAGRAVTVTVGLIDDRGFYVADDGPGIPAEKRERVFEEGYTTGADGSGTGLAIVDETVRQEGWRLSVGESETGGARFEVRNCPVVVPRETAPETSLTLDSAVDVGDVAVAGSADYDAESDRWTVVGAGEDVWSDIDELHFVHAETDGPVRIEARIDRLDDVHEFSKAGLMVRDDAEAGAPLVHIGTSGGHGTEVVWCAERGELTTSMQYEEPDDAYPWYRVERIGDTVTCFLSADGEEWYPVDQRRIDLADPVAVGLAVCSHVEDETAEAVFSNVAVHGLSVND